MTPTTARDTAFHVGVILVADPAWLTKSAFGELISHFGNDPRPYSFAGDAYDRNSGFYYDRARWLDPRVGRFPGIGPYAGNPFDPHDRRSVTKRI